MAGLKLLPSTATGFSSREYWDSFFTKRESDFEWYGEYDELAPLLRKFCSPKDSMLIVGCGGSNLSDRLHSDGFQNQLSIDISSIIIKRMQSLYPHLIFREDDVTGLHCSDEEFSCVLDKGTFDALAPPPPKQGKGDDALESKEVPKAIQMLNEIQRVLKKMGRFICISLLQTHVAELLVGYFVNLGWIAKINRCEAAETQSGNSMPGLPVYVCLFLKPLRSQPGQALVEFIGLENGGKPKRLSSVPEVIECLKSEMTMKYYTSALKTIGHSANAENEWNLCEDNGTLKYKLMVVDTIDFLKNPIAKQMIIFIIPQGRETEFMFGTNEGRSIIAKQMGYTRAVFVALQRDLQYPSMEEVQKEIGNHVQFITPDVVSDAKVKIPVVTVGSDLGCREVIHRGRSDFSGEYSIEDVKVGSNILRRLIFLDAPNIIQSEVPLKVVKMKVRGQGGKQESRTPVAHQLTSDYHGIMALSIPMLHCFQKQEESQNVELLLIGLGGGLLVSFLHHYLPTLNVTAVEIDQEIVEVGEKFFGLQRDERLRIVVKDGLAFINETELKYNVIMFDVDNKAINTGLSCPPAAFLSTEVLEATKKALNPVGIFVLNFVCRNSKLEDQHLKSLCSHFPFIYKFKLTKEVNTVFLCFMKPPPGNSKNLTKSLNKAVKHIRDVQVQDIPGKGKSKNTANSLIDMDDSTEDTIVCLNDEGVEDLCARFRILRAKD